MKRNLLKIPPAVLERVRTFDQDDVVVATVKLLQPADFARYAQLGIIHGDQGLVLPQPNPPRAEAGRYSRANVYGWEKVRRDLPKITKEFGFWSPNWGDWSNGSHYVSHEREVYQRDFYPPKEVELSIALVEERAGGFVLKFAIEQVINRRTPNFEHELLYNLNLLQENVGAADVFESAASLADYAASVRVDWQLLPPGTVDEVLARMLQGKRPVSADQQAVMKDRIAVMHRLKPEAFVTGTDGFLRYFGAKFGDDFVVFENVRYGNALYLMYENWQQLSQKSRIELLAGDRDLFDRIEHREGWVRQLEGHVQDYRDRKRRK